MGWDRALYSVGGFINKYFNVRAASNWYAGHAQANWNSGTLWGKGLAVMQDCMGGYVASWTGLPASTNQALWGAAWTVPVGLIGGLGGKAAAGIAKGLGAIGQIRGAIAGMSLAAESLSGGQQLTGYQAAANIMGLSGSYAGIMANKVPGMIFNGTGGQLGFGFASEWGNFVRGMLQTTSNFLGGYKWGFNLGTLLFSGDKSIAASQAASQAGTQVGGILFENCDATLTDIGEITGAYWDHAASSLVLIGSDGGDGSKKLTRLPAMDADHLLVALRAVYARQSIGVSIDPPAKYRDNDIEIPDGTPMLVSYLGETEGTLFGAIMFEADRLLKCLDPGVDNITSEQCRAHVPGYKPIMEMKRAGTNPGQKSWRRLWFVIDKIELRRDPATGTVLFSDVKLKVENEVTMKGQAGAQNDPATEYFTRHLTDHFDEYAREFPVFARLKELAKITSIAMYLVNEGVPMDIGNLMENQPASVETPSDTPGITVTSPVSFTAPDGKIWRSRSTGGVAMEPDPVIHQDSSGDAGRLKRAVESSKPSPYAKKWRFSESGKQQTAISLPFGKVSKPFRATCDDHTFSGPHGLGQFSLRRSYDSSKQKSGEFGPGWFLRVPYSITVFSQSGKREEVLTERDRLQNERTMPVLLNDNARQISDLYIVSGKEGQNKYFKVTSFKVHKGGAANYQYNPAEYLEKTGDGFLLSRNGMEYSFNQSGRLSGVRKGNANLINFEWDEKRILKIRNAENNTYSFSYEKGHPDRIAEISASDGSTIKYSYSRDGHLESSSTSDTGGEVYSYDNDGRLCEVRDKSGKVIERILYNGTGDHIKSGTDEVYTRSGEKIQRTIKNGRVISIRDDSSSTGEFRYNSGGALDGVTVKTQSGIQSWLSYNADGCLASYRDSSGIERKFSYDKRGNVKSFTDPVEGEIKFETGDDGRILGCTAGGEILWKAKYNGSDKPGSIEDRHGDKVDLFYSGDVLTGMTSREGGLRVIPSSSSLDLVYSDKDGCGWKKIYDREFRLVQYRMKGAGKVEFSYNKQGMLEKIRNESGIQEYELDERNLAMTVSFG